MSRKALQPTKNVKDISFLFISFSRSDLLACAINTLRTSLIGASFTYEIVIADDASPEPHLSYIRSLGADKMVVSRKNKGLNANCNQGIETCSGNHIVQIEDDWQFTGDRYVFERALRVFAKQADVGVIRLTKPSVGRDEVDRVIAVEGSELLVFRNDGENILKNASKRPYSNQPHIKRRRFCKSVGAYKERLEMHWGEVDYQLRVANQRAWAVAAFSDGSVFVHLGKDRSFNPVHARHQRLNKLANLPFIGPLFVFMRPILKKLRDGTGLFRRVE